MEKIVGTVDNVIFYNESNNYTVMDMDCNRELITVIGNFPAFKRGEYLSIEGEWTEHPNFGTQFKAQRFTLEAPKSREAMESYLASGIIAGLGDKKARLMVEHFGEDVLDIIRFNPSKLVEISGIGEKTALTISESYNENREVMEVIVMLGQYGIPSNYAMRIYKTYKEHTGSVIRENPYKIISEVPGMGFKSADFIAMNMGIENNSPFRIMAGIKYCLQMCYNEGHMFLEENDLTYRAVRLLHIDKDLMEYHISELTLQGEIKLQMVDEKRVYYPMSLFKAEENVANRIVMLNNYSHEQERIDVLGIIDKFQSESNIILDEIQVEAIMASIQNGVVIITGGPGTGKTTIINCILNIFKRLDYSVALAAPTGRAAKRMSESTGESAQTIHRMLEYGFSMDDDIQSFERNKENPLEHDVIIIDESSMIDTQLMSHLLDAISLGTRIIFVGDIYQLPSVGPGNVLRDFIDCGIINVVTLTKIFRQAQESMIVVNAHKVLHGQFPILNEKDKDFFFLNSPTGDGIKRKILDLCQKRLQKYNFFEDVQIITPIKKGSVGVIELNRAVQQILNPPREGKNEKTVSSGIYRVGDKVMQIKNNYNKEWDSSKNGEKGKGIYNGDIGIVENIINDKRKLVVLFDGDKKVLYDFDELDELMLSYAITVHKSQGSEFPVVIMPVSTGPSILQNRNLFYTAITRAKEMVILVGNKEVMRVMIKNTNNIHRYTGLRQRIENNIFAG
ncbi:MAG: ATP-dependent RecD-like DNA helicase [Eubacteriales bacterium]